MARKSRKAEQLQQEIINSVPVEQRKMIVQPITLTYLKGEYTMMQTRIQTSILEKAQEQIKRALDRRRKEGVFGDLFTADDYKPIDDNDRNKYLAFKVAYSELGIEPSHYDDVDRAAKAMQDIRYEKQLSDGRTRLTTVFPVIDIDSDTPGKRRQYIRLYMTESTVRDIFNLTRYHRYLKDAVFLFSSNYAGRIYLLINANKDLGTWTCDYEVLRKILLSTYNKESKELTVTKYRDFNDFKKRVLEPARKEIAEAAERIDCTFEYECIYPAGKKRGTPEKIAFHIQLTELGKKMKQKRLAASQQPVEIQASQQPSRKTKAESLPTDGSAFSDTEKW